MHLVKTVEYALYLICFVLKLSVFHNQRESKRVTSLKPFFFCFSFQAWSRPWVSALKCFSWKLIPWCITDYTVISLDTFMYYCIWQMTKHCKEEHGRISVSFVCFVRQKNTEPISLSQILSSYYSTFIQGGEKRTEHIQYEWGKKLHVKGREISWKEAKLKESINTKLATCSILAVYLENLQKAQLP